ncbi:MAG TPA: hypothetical protein VNW94_15420 [Streptosporangiaceae bacterium]|nr:hypothetical protein [Streptosporangiaceae bacterium]
MPDGQGMEPSRDPSVRVRTAGEFLGGQQVRDVRTRRRAIRVQ